MAKDSAIQYILHHYPLNNNNINSNNCHANRRRIVQQQRSSTTFRTETIQRRTFEHSLQPAGISCMLVLGEEGKAEKQRREPTQTQPNYGVGWGNRTWATLVGGECSHHNAIPTY